MWKVLFADDIALYHQNIKKAVLDKIFTSDVGSVDSSDYAFTGVNNANDLLTKNKYHLAFIDSLFEGENGITINDKYYEANVLGEALIVNHRAFDFPFHYFFITAHMGDKRDVNQIFMQYINDQRVTPFGKINIQGIEWQTDFRNEIRNRLRIIAKQLFEKMDSYQRIVLLNKCYNNAIGPLDTVFIDNETWTIKSLCLGWYNFESGSYENNLSNIIKDLIIPDLTMAASECFGILGIKQITHDASEYYYKDTRLFQKIKDQIDLINKCLDEISNDNIKEKILSFRNDIKEFAIEFENNRNQVYNEILRKKRNDFFQFKGDCFNDILGQDNKDSGNSDNFFELNVPIQKIFKKEFGLFIKSILEKSPKGAGAKAYNWVTLASKEKAEIVETFEIKLWNNFICFYHDGSNIFNPEDPNHYQANWLKFFHKSLNYFGKLYVLKKNTENNGYTVFDCTSDYVINLGELSEWKCVLKNKKLMKTIMTLQKNNYFIFSFLTKKPEDS